MKGVIYARYSSDNQREESIEGQIRECKAFAEKNGIDIIEIYIDRALSAKTDNRPDFQRLIKESGSKKFEVLLVWKLDRFARNKFDSAHYKRILKNNGVHVVSATEIISDGPEGILLESLLEGLEKAKRELSAQIAREELLQPPEFTRDQFLFWFEWMRKYDTTKLVHRRRLIDSFVNAIYLYDDRITFVFNFKDGTKTVTFAELEKSGLGSDINALAAPSNSLEINFPGLFSFQLICQRILFTTV